jgi:hypothetical protein
MQAIDYTPDIFGSKQKSKKAIGPRIAASRRAIRFKSTRFAAN